LDLKRPGFLSGPFVLLPSKISPYRSSKTFAFSLKTNLLLWDPLAAILNILWRVFVIQFFLDAVVILSVAYLRDNNPVVVKPLVFHAIV
jgi:hypothetical protein